MRDDFGDPVTVDTAIAQVQDRGSIVVHRAPVESEDFSTWRRQLRRSARERGIRLSVRHCGELTWLIYDPDHKVSPERLRAGIEAVAHAVDVPGLLGQTPPDATDNADPHLRIVDNSET